MENKKAVIGRKLREVEVKTATHIWAAAIAFAVCALIFPIYKIWAIILSAVISFFVGWLVNKIKKKEYKTVEVPVATGVPDADDREARRNIACGNGTRRLFITEL